MKSRLFRLELWVGLLLFGTILMWLAYEKWMEHTLVLAPSTIKSLGARVEVITDSVEGGASQAQLISHDSAWQLSYELRPGIPFPFTIFRLDLTDSLGKGMDLTQYSQIEIELKKQLGDYEIGRLLLRHEDPAYSQSDEGISLKYNETLLPLSSQRGVHILTWDRFYVPGWWVGMQKIPYKHSGFDVSNTRWIELTSPELMSRGKMELLIYRVVLRGKWMAEEDFFKLLLLVWLCTAGIFVTLKYQRLLTDIKSKVQHEKELKRLAQTDALTGLLNRRGFYIQWENIRYGVSPETKHFSVVFADVDFFKRINDTLGHEQGDEVLRQVAKTLASHIRSTDLIVRWGGEEFLILNTGGHSESSKKMAENLRKQVESLPIGVTCSFGIAAIHHGNLDDAICRADSALYRAKHSGRNRVEVDG